MSLYAHLVVLAQAGGDVECASNMLRCKQPLHSAAFNAIHVT